MTSKRCMNGGCGATLSAEDWRRGWALRSGGFATLCDKCGMAYEQSVFCDLFHQKESGWRECLLCGKRLHCGCIASKSLFELLDGGGVQCISCMKNSGLSGLSFIPSETIQEFLPQSSQRVLSLAGRSLKDEKANEDSNVRVDEDVISKGKAIQLGKNMEVNGQNNMLLGRRESLSGSFGHIKREQMAFHAGKVGNAHISNQAHIASSQVSQRDYGKDVMKDNMLCESLTQACLNISLGNSNQRTTMEPALSTGIRPSSGVEDGRDQSRSLSALQQAQRARHLLPKPSKTGQTFSSEASKEMLSNMRVARPPAEGRGRNQLLPRYWPRITDQELQQISGDSNSTIVPLFEKVLSASDAGRIGRLVLPKACAEAYFPPISQPEGLPLKIQDAKGKEWHFQFRFWPNNNSRMYVLEGVTPCIQSLQLQAGDTVTFSRMDPEGKLIMGFRKATNSVPLQDSQISAIANAGLGNETFFSGVTENLSIVSGYSGLLQSLKGTAAPRLSYFSEHLNLADSDVSWQKTDTHGGRSNDGFLLQPSLAQEKKRSRNIGGKSKRLHMDNDDALELKLSWEEAQDLLRPPPSAKPSVVMIEDQEFEEYEEPPVFGKRTIFTAQLSGEQDQWIQCDDCFKWRRLPVDVLVPSNWTCADNTCDPRRSSCSVPDELSPTEIHNLLRQDAEIKMMRTPSISKQNTPDFEASGLDALATAASIGDTTNQATVSASATTTKHPRHRPGCTCIVCIQPPSGKGPKHHPNCTCNVCLTVKRRFKTLMLRKKKRQSEREEAEANKRLMLPWGAKEEIEGSSIQKENELGIDAGKATVVGDIDTGKGKIDLNCQPEGLQSSSRVSMMSLLHVASLPLENYLKQNGLTSLTCEQQVSSSSVTVPQAMPVDESEERTPDEEGSGDEGHICSETAKSDAS
ncbi:B3 domain-containing protein Os07g0679700-like isoform X1 [Asparagus officinalis]|uniref:B3 domain-containing protein Os07g0679700-like isoform X1 n=1 Tax=Asparagus officinalis TaxID=4686 RepID=UPI00098E28AA|nr:B3 domain-containing protein Os07g0679700-like isoform X1 [Asparagus officinalis]XP_020275279.1 B3 domain-containing protein Os07g0679700-like isoform X1 [Asparagus officinalis]